MITNIYSTKKIITVLLISLFAGPLYAQNIPSIQWQKSIGGSNDDHAFSIQQMNDGGFVVAGYTSSHDGDLIGINHGGSDFLVVKLDSSGNLLWKKSLGGTKNEKAYSIKKTFDEGLIVAGFAESNDGDVTGNQGKEDYWIVKLDSLGELIWEKCSGGSLVDEAFAIQQTADSGFVVAGWSNSPDGDVTGNNGDKDYWIIKLDISGNLQWQKSLGGSAPDKALAIYQNADGGYIVGGESKSDDGDVSGNHGQFDYWIALLNGDGTLSGELYMGGSEDDVTTSVIQTLDGEYIAAGYSYSNNGNVVGHHGNYDYWLTKINSIGSFDWQKALGGTGADKLEDIQVTSDSGFIMTGYSSSMSDDVSGNHGEGDVWVVKADAAGDISWQECLGGDEDDGGESILLTSDNGVIVAGYAHSNNEDVSGHHGGPYYPDFWIVKLSYSPVGIPLIPQYDASLAPNPVSSELKINLTVPANNTTILVYDIHGRNVSVHTVIATNTAHLNVSKLPCGIYTVQIINNISGKTELCKFYKE